MRNISMRMFFLILLVFNVETRGSYKTTKTNSNLINTNINLNMYNNISTQRIEEIECVVDTKFTKKPLVTLNLFESNVDERNEHGTKMESTIANLSILSIDEVSRSTFKDTNKTQDKIDHRESNKEKGMRQKINSINSTCRLTEEVSQSILKEMKTMRDVADADEQCDFTLDTKRQAKLEEINEMNIEERNNGKGTDEESPIGNLSSLSVEETEIKLKEMNIILEDIDLNGDLTLETKKQDEIDDQALNVENNEAQDDIDDQFDMPLKMNKYGEQILSFFWLDAFENFENPGVVYMFGRATKGEKGDSISCCVIVKNIDRQIFLLPRRYKLDPTTEEPTDVGVTMADIQEEFMTVAHQLRIQEFRFQTVTKRSFEPGVPEETEWLEVKYPAKYPAIKTDNTYLTFSYVFGSNTSSLEAILLRNNIKGPSWLEVKGVKAVDVKQSWCKLEVTADVEGISVMELMEESALPPFVAVTINMKTAMGEDNRQKILMLCYLVHNSFPIHTIPLDTLQDQKFCLFTDHTNSISMDFKQTVHQDIKITKCDSKEELLSKFMVEFGRIDPDLVIGHDLRFQDLIGNLNISNKSRLTRLKNLPQLKYVKRRPFLGRLVCDLKLSAMELIKARSYDLNTLTITVLNITRGEQENNVLDENLGRFNDSDDIIQLVKLTTQDAVDILKIVCKLNVMPIAFEITRIVGNVMSRTLIGNKSERNEFLLLHAFTEKNYIVPYKKKVPRPPRIWTKKTPAYSGGLVLDPKRGFYDKVVLLMDFNSLYPSVIQEFNICFTTLKNYECVNTSSVFGILPMQIQKLVESRRVVKKLMDSADSIDIYKQYNIRQMALKLTANTMYGCLGYPHSRFYAKSLASSITKKGREILMDAKDIVENLNFEVLYGDTDSLMVNTNFTDYDHALNIGQDLKRKIDNKYKHVQIGMDGVFKYLLLLKKKKYAGVLINKSKGEYVLSREYKGLDVVRRDFPILAADAGKYVLNQIMSDQTEDKKIRNVEIYLKRIKEDLKSGKTPISKFIMNKRLARNPDKYYAKYAEFMPQVQVATRLNVENSRRFKKGDMVSYIICEDGTDRSAMQRAYHVEEINKSVFLKVDYQYYLVQLHSVITRLSEGIRFLTPVRIAKYLGIKSCIYNVCKTVSHCHRKKNQQCLLYEEIIHVC